MLREVKLKNQERLSIKKAPTGIPGLDEITEGGLPASRTTLVCGGAGAGKTMLATEFLVRGATEFNEPGVYVMFEESAQELAENVRSVGFDLAALVERKQIGLDHVHIERTENYTAGDYDLEGLFIRIGHAVESVGARRIVLDTLEALFSGFPNHAVLRAELHRLFQWLKGRHLTALVTAESGDQKLTRYGLEEYVADCVIVLDHRVNEQISTRRLRVVKYRGSAHGTNEYPFLIGRHGLSVLPVTSLQLDYKVSAERVSTGIPRLDEMLGQKGFHRGSSVLVSGDAGTGKSTLGAAFLDAACRRGERGLLFAYEESGPQILRNMKSVGYDLDKWVKQGLLEIHATRPSLQGLEQHLVMMYDSVRAFRPSIVVVDPISNLMLDANVVEIKPTLIRLIDFLKGQQITAVFVSLTSKEGPDTHDNAEAGVASLMDTWLLVRNLEYNGERNRTLYVMKARGIAHSNQVREFVLSDKGIDLVDVYMGAGQVLTGSARLAQAMEEQAAAELRRQDHERRLRHLAGKRRALEAQIAALQAELDAEGAEAEFAIAQQDVKDKTETRNARTMAETRGSHLIENSEKERRRAHERKKS